MENNGPVEGQIQRQEKVRETQGIEHPGLDGGKQRHTAFNIWVPEGKMTLADSFNPNKAKRIEEGTQISFYQQDLACKHIVKVEENEDEKAQAWKNCLRCWASMFHH
jgi:hypothetical protein